ncbi:hypothetical protein BS78_06G022400 [Paspalum vaginatum]|nr:hypothetical protein BS78_06G022400 [Paspalum vaginatum]
MEELVELILLRFPTHEPACLIRAALDCKPWCALVSSHGFRRRFRELHRMPSLLGITRFVPTTNDASSWPQLAVADRRSYRAALEWNLGACHGRVLLHSHTLRTLAVWDPVTDEQREFPVPDRWCVNWTAAVLCAGAVDGACNHLGCHRGPLFVVYVGAIHDETFVYTYSSDAAAAWSERASTPHPCHYVLSPLHHHIIVRGEFTLLWVSEFLHGSISSTIYVCLRQMSWIHLPAMSSRLGLAALHGFKLYMWSREDAPPQQVDGGIWTQTRVMALDTLLPAADAILNPPYFNLLARMLVPDHRGGRAINSVIPYMGFYTPALGAACTGDGPSVGASSA